MNTYTVAVEAHPWEMFTHGNIDYENHTFQVDAVSWDKQHVIEDTEKAKETVAEIIGLELRRES